jgi:hypothetical protein
VDYAAIYLVPDHRAYRLAFKSATTQNDHAPDGIVIEIRFTARTASRPGRNHQVNDSNEILEFQNFFVECKRPQCDTPAEWDNAREQLCHYLEINTNGSSRLYGAIGIRTKAIFYEWNKSLTPSLRPLHASTIDVSESSGRVELEALLQHVKVNGWDLASLPIP